jgi:hypothetical protein
VGGCIALVISIIIFNNSHFKIPFGSIKPTIELEQSQDNQLIQGQIHDAPIVIELPASKDDLDEEDSDEDEDVEHNSGLTLEEKNKKSTKQMNFFALSLEDYKNKHQNYPASLRELPINSQADLIDPFSGQYYEYELKENGANYRLCTAFNKSLKNIMICYNHMNEAKINDRNFQAVEASYRPIEINNIKSIRLQLKNYYAKNAKYPNTIEELTPTYLASNPNSPWGNNYEYYSINNGSDYKLYFRYNSYVEAYCDSTDPVAF